MTYLEIGTPDQFGNYPSAAIGATIGQVIDQRLLGNGSDVVETGRVDRFRLTGSGEGAPVAQLYGGGLTLSPAPLGGLRAELLLPAV